MIFESVYIDMLNLSVVKVFEMTLYVLSHTIVEQTKRSRRWLRGGVFGLEADTHDVVGAHHEALLVLDEDSVDHVVEPLAQVIPRRYKRKLAALVRIVHTVRV